MDERRTDERFLCADLVQVVWSAGPGPDGGEEFRTAEALLEDISTQGVCVQVEETIPTGAHVVISAEGVLLCGDVSYCRYRDYGYFVGVRLTDKTRWSSGRYAPQHLTDLRTLTGVADD